MSTNDNKNSNAKPTLSAEQLDELKRQFVNQIKNTRKKNAEVEKEINLLKTEHNAMTEETSNNMAITMYNNNNSNIAAKFEGETNLKKLKNIYITEIKNLAAENRKLKKELKELDNIKRSLKLKAKVEDDENNDSDGEEEEDDDSDGEEEEDDDSEDSEE